MTSALPVALDLETDDTELSLPEAVIIEPVVEPVIEPVPEPVVSPTDQMVSQVVDTMHGWLVRIGLLPTLREKHAVARAAMDAANEGFREALASADRTYAKVTAPLAATLKELEVEITAAESAQQRLAELAESVTTKDAKG